MKAAGLTDQIEVLGSDYRDLQGTFDKLVSIEMIEAVDWRLHDTFFATCQRLLKPSGLMLLQAIVVADGSYERAKHHDDFIRRMIFPGGCIPSIAAICASLARATDLRVFDLEDIGRHYATTLRRWFDNLDANWETTDAAGLDDRFHRLWNLYLCYCEAAFLERHVSDIQMVIAGSGRRPALDLPSAMIAAAHGDWAAFSLLHVSGRGDGRCSTTVRGVGGMPARRRGQRSSP